MVLLCVALLYFLAGICIAEFLGLEKSRAYFAVVVMWLLLGFACGIIALYNKVA